MLFSILCDSRFLFDLISPAAEQRLVSHICNKETFASKAVALVNLDDVCMRESSGFTLLCCVVCVRRGAFMS